LQVFPVESAMPNTYIKYI